MFKSVRRVNYSGDLFNPCPPNGRVSTRLLKPAMSGRAFAIVAVRPAAHAPQAQAHFADLPAGAAESTQGLLLCIHQPDYDLSFHRKKALPGAAPSGSRGPPRGEEAVAGEIGVPIRAWEEV